MSSFRVERQRVSFLPQAEIVREGQPPAESEYDRQMSEVSWEKQQAEHEKAYARQLLETSRSEAEKLLEQARHEADRILAEAGNKAQLLLEQEKERGYAAGRQEAAAADEQWKADGSERLRKIAGQLEQQYRDKLDEVRKDAGDLALEIAEKVIGIRLEESDADFLRVLDSAMSRFRQSDSVTVFLSEEDYQRLSDGRLEERKGREVTLEKKESLRRGDCLLESEDQFVDCGIPGQLDRLRRTLQGTEEEGDGHEQSGAEVSGAPAGN